MLSKALLTEMRERPYLHIAGLDGDGLLLPSGAAAPLAVQPGPATVEWIGYSFPLLPHMVCNPSLGDRPTR